MVQNKSHISAIIGLFPTFIPTDNHYYQYVMYSLEFLYVNINMISYPFQCPGAQV